MPRITDDADRLASQVAAAMFAREGTGAAWNLDIIEVSEGFARVAMTVRADMLNGHGTIHGGMIFALADSAFAYACNSRNITTVAQGASISFLAPAEENDLLMAEAREVTRAGRSGVYDVHVTKGDGSMIAVFQGLSRALGSPILNEKEIADG